MKTLLLILSLTLCGCKPATGYSYPEVPPWTPPQIEPDYNLKEEAIICRDPFILVDRKEGAYYFAASTGKGFKAYKSLDLENWADLGLVFNPATDFWGKTDFWAPDMYEYKGKFYIFGTFTGTTEKRGVGILIADSPAGPYSPLRNNPVTPREWMCLDGALYIDDNGTPWMLYIRDWLDRVVGAVYAQRFSDDLTELTGEPVLLFQADSAPWAGLHGSGSYRNYLADSPWIIDIPGGRKTLIWSSHTATSPQRYAIGQAYSASGSISGPWTHDPQPLNDDDGGHCMVFTGLDGKMRIAYHAPNSANGALISGHPTFKKIAIDNNGKITIQSK
jgi:sucrose-6-phosphate hydrolase SacC (GH32 family)